MKHSDCSRFCNSSDCLKEDAMGRGDGGGPELARTTVRKARHKVADKFDMKNKKAARHWLKKPLPPRESPAIGSPLRQPRAQWPVRPAEPWWPGGALETVQQSEAFCQRWAGCVCCHGRSVPRFLHRPHPLSEWCRPCDRTSAVLHLSSTAQESKPLVPHEA